MVSSADVLSHTQVHEHLWKLELLASKGPEFEAGQYVSWHIDGQRHGPFSIASAPSQLPVLTFYSRYPFIDIAAKMTIEIGPAHGKMTAADPTKRYILCAGGTGITPFLSLWHAFAPGQRDFSLFWSMSHASDSLMLCEHDSRVVTHDYENDPPYTNLIQPYLGGANTMFYVAGPMPFVRLMAQWLVDNGTPADQIASDMLDPRRLVASSQQLEL